MSDLIATVEEIDDLPPGSVVAIDGSTPWIKISTRWTDGRDVSVSSEGLSWVVRNRAPYLLRVLRRGWGTS